MDDLQEQIEQLRANRAKQREEHDFDDFFDNEEKPKKVKKPEGIMAVITVQAIVCLVIAIIYILIMTFSKDTSISIVNTVKDKAVNDFSFKESVYEVVGNAISYLNQIEPVDIQISSDETATDDISSQETSPSDETEKSTESDVSQEVSSEIPSGEGGEPNPVSGDTVPTNATLAPVIFTGRITFPIEKGYRITSNFGFRDNPIDKENEFHNALDIAAAKDTPVMAAANGVVKESGEDKYLGKHIIIDHGNGFVTTYGHCNKLIAKKGTHIREGEIIAKVGSTGKSNGYHLHFAMQKDGLYFNPAYIFKSETANA